MVTLLLNVTFKLLLELLDCIAIGAILLGVLWIWDKISPQSFEKTLKRVARYFR